MQNELGYEKVSIGITCDRCRKNTDTFLCWEKYKVCVECDKFLRQLVEPLLNEMEVHRNKIAKLESAYINLIDNFFGKG